MQYGAEVKGDARSAVMMKYPEFEQDSDDEDDDEEEEDEDAEEGDIKLPKLITKETVLAVLKPNVVRQKIEFRFSFNTVAHLVSLVRSLSNPRSTSASLRTSRLSSFRFRDKS